MAEAANLKTLFNFKETFERAIQTAAATAGFVVEIGRDNDATKESFISCEFSAGPANPGSKTLLNVSGNATDKFCEDSAFDGALTFRIKTVRHAGATDRDTTDTIYSLHAEAVAAVRVLMLDQTQALTPAALSYYQLGDVPHLSSETYEQDDEMGADITDLTYDIPFSIAASSWPSGTTVLSIGT